MAMNIRIPDDLDARLTRIAKRLHISKSALLLQGAELIADRQDTSPEIQAGLDSILADDAILLERLKESPASTVSTRFDSGIEARLRILAERTGRSTAFYINEALIERLDDYEDYFLAKDALEEFRQSDDAPIELADVVWPQG